MVYKAFENLDGFKHVLGRDPPPLLAMVFVFGLIHGLGLATRLQQLTLQADPSLWIKLLCFNVGVELGQIAALLAAAGALWAWRDSTLWPRFATVTNCLLLAGGLLLFVLQLKALLVPHNPHLTMHKPANLALILFALSLCAAANDRVRSGTTDSSGEDSDAAAKVDGVVVKGEALRDQPSAYSATQFDADDIAERSVTEIEQLFREVPGMNVRDYNLSGVANQIVIRGFGNGAHGGDLGMVIDGIPLNEANSHADGYADSAVLIPLEIDTVTVYRGPVSALYGNFNRGGLVAYETRKGGDYLVGHCLLGSYESVDAQTAYGSAVGARGQFNGAAQLRRSDGFRPQSDSDGVTLSGRYSIALNPSFDLAASVRAHTADGNSPAYLTFDQYQTDPYGIDPRVQNDGSSKDFATLRVDAALSIAPDVRALAFVYATQQDFVRYFTRGPAAPTATWLQREEAYDRRVGGAGLNLNGLAGWASADISYVIGVEAFNEDTEFQFDDGLDFRRRVNPAVSDRESELRSVSAFGEAIVSLHPRLELSVGGRYDRFTGDCRLLGPETGSNPCSELESVDHFSPKVGLRAPLTDWLTLRTSYAEGFALPNDFAKFATGAQDLEPNELEQIEAGITVQLGEQFSVDVIRYQLDSSNEFASTAPGVFENFGDTERDGSEWSLRYTPTTTFELRAIYNQADSSVERNLNPALIGKQVTGVPDETGTLTVDWQFDPRWRFNAVYRSVGSYATNATNTVFSPRYDVFDVGLRFDLKAFEKPAMLYLSVENVADEVYASTFNSLGSIATGWPRTVRIGLQLGQ